MKNNKELSDEVDKILKQMGDIPLINTRIYTSKDDRYIIQETCIKTIKPTAYYQAIIDNMGKEKPYRKKEGGYDAKK